jgi:hypothetical protein
LPIDISGTGPDVRPPAYAAQKEHTVIALGLILLIIGLIAGIGVLTTIGAILLVVGLVLNLVPIGGSTRRVW